MSQIHFDFKTFGYDALTSINNHIALSLPSGQWSALTGLIREEFHGLLICDIAVKLDLKWPNKSKLWNNFNVAQCLMGTIEQLQELKGMGDQKLSTILLSITHLAENPQDYDRVKEQTTLISYEELKSSSKSWLRLSAKHWNDICASVPSETYKITIKKVALDLGLYWPAKNWDNLQVEHCLLNTIRDVSAIPSLGKKKLRTIILVLLKIVESNGLPSYQSLTENEIWNHPVIRNLKGREEYVFLNRILPLLKKETLDSLGYLHGVTRERIRQIEKSILERIETSNIQNHLKEELSKYIHQFLLPKYQARRYLLNDELEDLATTISNEISLAISLHSESLKNLLSELAIETKNGWYFVAQEEFLTIENSIHELPEDILPLSISHLSEITGINESALISHAKITNFAAIEGHYFIPNKSGNAHSKRAIFCYNYGLSKERALWTHNELIKDATGTTDRNTTRIYRASILNCKRLFTSTPSHLSILKYKNDYHEKQPTTAPKSEGEKNTQHQDLAYSKLKCLFLEAWPITGKNIVRKWKRASPQLDLSNNSLIPTISSDPDTLRLAPGVYGPKQYTVEPIRLERARRLALSEKDLRHYCFAKRCGENTKDIFPLWDEEQEQRWYRKIQKKEDTELFSTFANIADQSTWPEQLASEKLKILDLKISSQFEIKPSWIINRTYRAPSLPETLTALRYSHDIGPLSWIRANHILCSSQITDEVGISAVALGIALGLLDKTKRPWWQKVPVSKDFSNIWSEIEALHLEDSPPTWQHPCIQKMLQTAKIQADAQKLSFVRRDTLHNILHELMKQVAQKDTA